MDQAAADKVAEDLGFKWANGLHAPDTLDTPDSAEAIQAADGYHKALWNHAVSLQSQLSASEERVRALEKGVALIRDCADPKTSSLTSSDAACMAIQMAAKSMLPSPPQVESTK